MRRWGGSCFLTDWSSHVVCKAEQMRSRGSLRPRSPAGVQDLSILSDMLKPCDETLKIKWWSLVSHWNAKPHYEYTCFTNHNKLLKEITCTDFNEWCFLESALARSVYTVCIRHDCYIVVYYVEKRNITKEMLEAASVVNISFVKSNSQRRTRHIFQCTFIIISNVC